MNRCRDCLHYSPPSNCNREEASDLVNGGPADCHMQRYGDVPQEGEPPICGYEGQWFEAATVEAVPSGNVKGGLGGPVEQNQTSAPVEEAPPYSKSEQAGY